MAETLGSLCDKLTIIKLKQWHSEDKVKLQSLGKQEEQLKTEIDEFVSAAVCGKIPIERLTFDSNKIYRKDGNEVRDIIGSIGEVFSNLTEVNCKLWHEQEKVYDFENVPANEKDIVVKNLAILNLERNLCIDKINENFRIMLKSKIEDH